MVFSGSKAIPNRERQRKMGKYNRTAIFYQTRTRSTLRKNLKERLTLKRSEMEANLYCSRCHEETPHVIVYINAKLKNVECEDCNRVVGVNLDVRKEFYKEIYERISTKPSRITKEYNEDLSKFLLSLPTRVISKPYRLIRYLNETHKVFRQYKK